MVRILLNAALTLMLIAPAGTASRVPKLAKPVIKQTAAPIKQSPPDAAVQTQLPTPTKPEADSKSPVSARCKDGSLDPAGTVPGACGKHGGPLVQN